MHSISKSRPFHLRTKIHLLILLAFVYCQCSFSVLFFPLIRGKFTRPLSTLSIMRPKRVYPWGLSWLVMFPPESILTSLPSSPSPRGYSLPGEETIQHQHQRSRKRAILTEPKRTILRTLIWLGSGQPQKPAWRSQLTSSVFWSQGSILTMIPSCLLLRG